MTWTEETWDAFVALLEGWWPGDFPEESAEAWRLALDGVEPSAAVTALKVMLHEGRRFRPSASELLAVLRKDPSLPTFDEAFRLLYGRGGPVRAHVLGDPLGDVHPLVISFAARQGVERLAGLPVDDPDWKEKVRHDLEERWEAHLQAMEGREVAVLATGARDGLRRLDPLTSFKTPDAGPHLLETA